MPRISVLMAAYNNASTVTSAVFSILQQTFQDLEFIIVNDGSTDDSGRQLRDLARQDQRIVLIEQSNHGLTQALVRAAALARGRYIARQDADDVSELSRLERQMSFVPRYDVVATRSRREDGRPRPSIPIALLHRYVLPFRNPFYHGTLLMKKEVFERAGGYDPAFPYAQDYDLMARLAVDRSVRIKYLLEPLYRTGSAATSISMARRTEQEECARRVRDRIALDLWGVVERWRA
ncbi:MAG: glycosyltransferase [Elusimicrobia bacterium]|nr:glycosyltransferase [Elusimicrobiota bacterium]